MKRAAELGFAALAITDHDGVSGVSEALEAGREYGIEVLAGVEVSTSFGSQSLHVVGLGIDHESPEILRVFQAMKEGRSARADRIIARLNELGVPVERSNVVDRTADGTIGRMHIAQEIVKLGYAETVQGAFDKYIKQGRPAYVAVKKKSCDRAIEQIHGAGGVVIVAHPGIGSTLHKILPKLLQLPFDGIEAYHTKHTPGQTEQYLQLAKEKKLLISGGSDCHGRAKGEEGEMGKVRVPYEYYEKIKEAIAARKT